MKCPVTGHSVISDQDDDCTEYTLMVACKSCPAYTKRLLLQRWLVHFILPFLVGIMMFGAQVVTASAHDPTHDAPKMVKRVIEQGKNGGVYRVTKNGLFGTWTDGTHVAILSKGRVVTIYRSRDAAGVAARAATEKGAVAVSTSKASTLLSTARKIGGAAGSNLLGLIPAVILDQTCWRGATNICLNGERRNE